VKCSDCGNEAQGNVCVSCGRRLLPPLPMRGGSEDAGRGAEEFSEERPPSAIPREDEIAPPPSSVPGAEEPTLPAAEEGVYAEAEVEAAGPAVGAEPSGSNWARELGVGGTPTGTSGATDGATSDGARSVSFPGGFTFRIPQQVEDWLAPVEGVGKQYLAWIGSALLFIGVFLSTKTLTVSAGVFSASGSRTLWDWATFWAVVLVLLAIASAGVAYLRDYKWLLLTGAASLVILIIEFLWTFSAGVSYPGVSAHPSWGWIVLFPGALLILAAGAARSTPRDAEDNEGLSKVMGQTRSAGGTR
jgi:hypothetical protein